MSKCSALLLNQQIHPRRHHLETNEQLNQDKIPLNRGESLQHYSYIYFFDNDTKMSG